jgi:hypothetical protein
MNCLRFISFVALAGKLLWGGDGVDEREKGPAADANRTATSNRLSPPAVRLPRVLSGFEPKDTTVVILPGPVAPKHAPARPPARPFVAPGWRPKGVPVLPPAPEVVLARRVATADNLGALTSFVPPPPRFPAPDPSPALAVADAAGDPVPPAETTVRSAPLSAATDVGNAPIALVMPPATPPAKTGQTASLPDPHNPAYPAGFAQEIAVFCQKRIGHWMIADARAVLGEPQRQRPAFADDSTEDGAIYAFRDPTSRYREMELDFGKENGLLRSVFVYPWNLTWQDCRKLWGTNVSATEGNKGRIFYSYVNRHLDVLVDHDGKVISLGLY